MGTKITRSGMACRTLAISFRHCFSVGGYGCSHNGPEHCQGIGASCLCHGAEVGNTSNTCHRKGIAAVKVSRDRARWPLDTPFFIFCTNPRDGFLPSEWGSDLPSSWHSGGDRCIAAVPLPCVPT